MQYIFRYSPMILTDTRFHIGIGIIPALCVDYVLCYLSGQSFASAITRVLADRLVGQALPANVIPHTSRDAWPENLAPLYWLVPGILRRIDAVHWG